MRTSWINPVGASPRHSSCPGGRYDRMHDDGEYYIGRPEPHTLDEWVRRGLKRWANDAGLKLLFSRLLAARNIETLRSCIAVGLPMIETLNFEGGAE